MKTTVNQSQVYIVTCQILEATAAAQDQMNPLFILTERDLSLLEDIEDEEDNRCYVYDDDDEY